MRSPALGVALLSTLCGCSTHDVNTADGWCEQISGVDITEKYAPFWALIPGVKFHGDEIRTDFSRSLNAVAMKSVQGRADRMAWNEGVDLHIVNPGNLNAVDPEEVISDWRERVESAWNPGGKECVMGSVVSLFDHVHIHTWEWDELSNKVIADHVTTIQTQRKAKLKDPI